MYRDDETVGIQNRVFAAIDRKKRDRNNKKLHSAARIALGEELYSMVSELFFTSRVYLNYNERSVCVKINNAREHVARVNNPTLFKQYEKFCKDNSVTLKRPNMLYSSNITLHVTV